MYKITATLLTLFFLLQVSCKNDQKKVVPLLQGRIENASQVVLFQRIDSLPITVDTLELAEDGSFSIINRNLNSDFYRLISGDKIVNLILEKDSTTHLNCDFQNIRGTLSFSGFNQSKYLFEVEQLARELENDLKFHIDTIKGMVGTVTPDSVIQSMYLSMDSVKISYKKRLNEMLEVHGNQLVAIPILLLQSGNFPIYTLPKDRAVFMKTQFALSQRYYNSYQVRRFASLVHKIYEKFDGIGALEKGDKLPDLDLFTSWNERLTLSSLMGKYVMVVVWDSRNALSRTRTKEVSKLMWRYRSNGLETYMISLDTDKEAWQTAVKEDELNCFHVTDLLGSESPVIPILGVERLPTLYLLNREGKIVAKNIWGDKLDDAIASLVLKK